MQVDLTNSSNIISNNSKCRVIPDRIQMLPQRRNQQGVAVNNYTKIRQSIQENIKHQPDGNSHNLHLKYLWLFSRVSARHLASAATQLILLRRGAKFWPDRTLKLVHQWHKLTFNINSSHNLSHPSTCRRRTPPNGLIRVTLTSRSLKYSSQSAHHLNRQSFRERE